MYFDAVHLYRLSTLDADFRERNAAFLPNPDGPVVNATTGAPLVRGCGYWLWKPQSILQVLRTLRDGDVVVYADAGSTIHGHNWPRFYEYIQLVRGLPPPQVPFPRPILPHPRFVNHG